MEKFTVLDLLQLDLKEHDALGLKCIGGRPGLIREIKIPEINAPKIISVPKISDNIIKVNSKKMEPVTFISVVDVSFIVSLEYHFGCFFMIFMS